MTKRIIIGLISLFSSTFCFSQIKVSQSGNVGIGITGTPLSLLSVGTTGNDYFKASLQGDKVTFRISGDGNSPYNIGYWGTGLLVTEEVTSFRGDKGIEAGVMKSSPSLTGRAIGITGIAGNASSGYNYGVIGSLGGSNNGTGILGNASGDYEGIPIDGFYAGYFNGNVKVTGTINGVTISASDLRYKRNVEEFAKTGALKELVRLNPVSFNYQQVYFEYPSDTVTVKRGLFDEKSQMFQKKHFGLIAQELQAVYPELVYQEDNGYLSVNYTELIPVLIQSIKELKQEIDGLKTAELESRSATANAGIDALGKAVLYQNAPNPFSEKTVIRFSLPESVSSAAIYIFNMQGGLIKQVAVRGNQTSISVNGSELAAGMYMYSRLLTVRRLTRNV